MQIIKHRINDDGSIRRAVTDCFGIICGERERISQAIRIVIITHPGGSVEFLVSVGNVAVDDTGDNSTGGYFIGQNFPNPCNGQSTIRYTIPQESIVSLKVYDIQGIGVQTLVDEKNTQVPIH